jgi:hypothetical protein
MISNYSWDHKTRPWAELVYRKFASILEELDIYWAVTIGNHDFLADLSVRGVMDLDMSYPHSLTTYNRTSAEDTGEMSYWLPVYDQNTSEVLLRLWFINPNAYKCPGE